MKKFFITLLFTAASWGQISIAPSGGSVGGASSLTDANRVVIVASSGVLGQTSYAHTTLVQGATNLTSAGANIPYVSSDGTLSEADGISWDSTNRDFYWKTAAGVIIAGISTNYAGDQYNSSMFVLNPENTRPPSVSSATGTTAPSIDIQGMLGGLTTITTTGTGGTGANVQFGSGNGAECTTANTACTGGMGGRTTIYTGNGGVVQTATGNNLGGSAQPINIYAGNGGVASNGTSNTGGGGADIRARNGSGGTGSTAAGSDGTFKIIAGARANDEILEVMNNAEDTIYFRILSDGSTTVFKGADVASAATMTLTGGNLFHITGTTSITTMNTCDATNAGREVMLIFDGVLTFTDGNNLKLAGNFVTTADDSITLWCDGSNWYEQARSVN